MDLTNLFVPTNRQELRNWLLENSEQQRECWVVIKQAETEKNLTYLDIVEEAICFGWIDSTKKKINEFELAQRISPRSKKSNWTELNKARARRLIELELMTEQGQRSLPEMAIEQFKIEPVILTHLAGNPLAEENFQHFPALYQRIRIDTIQAYKQQEVIFEKRLKKFIEQTAKNKIYGQWNDSGRLKDYH